MQGESIKLVDDAMSKDRIIGLTWQKHRNHAKRLCAGGLYTVGTSAMILKMAKYEENKLQLLVQGLGRIKIQDYIARQSPT